MADITKCSGADCDLKMTCYRYTAPKGTWQSYFMNPPIKDGECEYYWGEASQSTYDQLKETFNTKEK